MNFTGKKGTELARRIAEASGTYNIGTAAVTETAVCDYFQTDSRFNNHVLPTLEKEFPWLHDRPATTADFDAFCKEHDVEVMYESFISHGVYVLCPAYDDQRFIFLNPDLHDGMLRYVMFHELAHCLFHFPSQSNIPGHVIDREQQAKNHLEAEIVAAFLTLPVSRLHR